MPFLSLAPRACPRPALGILTLLLCSGLIGPLCLCCREPVFTPAVWPLQDLSSRSQCFLICHSHLRLSVPSMVIACPTALTCCSTYVVLWYVLPVSCALPCGFMPLPSIHQTIKPANHLLAVVMASDMSDPQGWAFSMPYTKECGCFVNISLMPMKSFVFFLLQLFIYYTPNTLKIKICEIQCFCLPSSPVYL